MDCSAAHFRPKCTGTIYFSLTKSECGVRDGEKRNILLTNRIGGLFFILNFFFSSRPSVAPRRGVLAAVVVVVVLPLYCFLFVLICSLDSLWSRVCSMRGECVFCYRNIRPIIGIFSLFFVHSSSAHNLFK